MDFIFLKLWYYEFLDKFSGSYFKNSWQRDKTYNLHFGEGVLQILLHSGDPILFFDEKVSPEKSVNGFITICREHLKGAELEKIELADNDKVITLHFTQKDIFGNKKIYTLIIELINRYENVILTETKKESTDTILGAHNHVTLSDSKFRQILPGEPYKQPPKLKGPYILNLSQKEFLDITGEQIDCSWKDFIKNFSNMPKLLEKYYIKGQKSLQFWHKVEKLKKRVKSFRQGSQKVYYDLENKHLTFFEPEDGKDFSSMNSAFKFYFQHKIKQKQKKILKQNVLQRMQKKREALKKKIGESKKKLENLEKAPTWKRYGELLKVNLHKLKKGQESVKVIDYYDEEQPQIEIPVNPQWTPQKNMKQYFKKFKKAKSGKDKLQKYIKESKEELKEIENKINQIQHSRDEKLLREKQKQLFQKQDQTNKKRETANKFRRFTIETGKKEWQVIVGRTSSENDELTTRIANSNDWFFHSRIYHGSHVIVKNDEKRDSLPNKVLRFAAGIAAYFSKAKHSKKVPVDYTKIKYVRKPRNSPPGFVVYDHQKTVFISPINPHE